MDLQHIKQEITHFLHELFDHTKLKAKKADDQQHVMTTEEKLDETAKESFPASDPPGSSHFSGEVKQ